MPSLKFAPNLLDDRMESPRAIDNLQLGRDLPDRRSHHLEVVGSNPTPATIYVGLAGDPIPSLIRRVQAVLKPHTGEHSWFSY